MTEEAKRNSTAANNYLDNTVKIMRENEEFLRNNTEETYEAVVGLINYAIDLIGSNVKGEKSRKDYVRHSMFFFLLHILMPSSYAIYINWLIGNLPTCFMELRLILEVLVKCYLADLEYPDKNFFQEKLELLEKELIRNNTSTSRLMKDLGKKLGLKNDFIALWGELSKDWIHTKGVVDRVVNQIIKSRVLSWPLVIPINYSKDDLDTIEELGKRISQFRNLLKATIENYQQEFSF